MFFEGWGDPCIYQPGAVLIVMLSNLYSQFTNEYISITACEWPCFLTQESVLFGLFFPKQ